MKTAILASVLGFTWGITLLASPRVSTNYSIAADGVDDGGARTSSAAYTIAGSTGGFAGATTTGPAGETAQNGFIGQLYEVTGFAVAAAAPGVNAGDALHLGAWQLLDDATLLAAPDWLEFQWYHDGNPISGATQWEYAVASAQSFHNGEYSVRITQTDGSTVLVNPVMLTVNAPAPNDGRLLNLSTRGLAQTGDSVLIPGFVVQGTGNKTLLIRAVGPTLGVPPINFGGTVIPDPQMTLKRLDESTTPPHYEDVIANDDWQTNSNSAEIATTAAELFAFELKEPKDAALLVDLPAGQYSVVAGDKNGDSGIAIVELYDADGDNPSSRLINISNRGYAGVGDEVMIPGFVVSDEGPKTLLVRVVGPTLAAAPYNVAGTMADPKLTVYSGQNAILANDNWSENPDADYTAQIAQQVQAFPLAADSADAAFVVTLEPGTYTVVGSSAVDGGTGIVLVEIYVVP